MRFRCIVQRGSGFRRQNEPSGNPKVAVSEGGVGCAREARGGLNQCRRFGGRRQICTGHVNGRRGLGVVTVSEGGLDIIQPLGQLLSCVNP